MQYIERTLQVRAALLAQPDLLEIIRGIFASHIAKDGKRKPVGEGSSRSTYRVGECEITPGTKVNLLLKLQNEFAYMKYEWAAECSCSSGWSELGAFEMYYDFIAGHISSVSFQSKESYEQYLTVPIIGKRVDYSFSLAEEWGGTKVGQGDIGAVPYFQMVVQYQDWFGWLTEGVPPLIKPKYTAQESGEDCHTVEEGRIIDIDPSQCRLIEIDRGEKYVFRGEYYPNNLGVRLRGEKYFLLEHRLDV